MLRPFNLVRLATPALSRSDLAAEYYHEKVFDGATFADLKEAKGPRVYINATDLSDGHRFTFSQGQFDAICSDLDAFPIARAVAASSAVPMLLSPITLSNHAGTCEFEVPEVLREALETRESDPRRYRAAEAMAAYLDADKKPYIHLVDGGISDNLGLRATLELMAAVGGGDALRRLYGLTVPDHLVVIIVNAERDPDPSIDLSYAAPSFAALMNSVSGSQIRRYNFETILLTRQAVSQTAADLSRPGRPVRSHVAEVDFALFEDEAERDYFRLLPTSFSLSDEQIDRLRSAGRQLLRDSPGFQKLLRTLR
jgi:NTE family protein